MSLKFLSAGKALPSTGLNSMRGWRTMSHATGVVRRLQMLEDDTCQNVTECRGSAKKAVSGTLKNAVDLQPGGWLRESTGTSSRSEAEQILIRRLAETGGRGTTTRGRDLYTLKKPRMRYLTEIAHKSSADTCAMHLDKLFPFIGKLPVAQVHDGTLHRSSSMSGSEGWHQSRSTIAIGVVAAVLNRAARVWRDRGWQSLAPAGTGKAEPAVHEGTTGKALPAVVGGAGQVVPGPATASGGRGAVCGEHGLPGAGGLPAPLGLGSGRAGYGDFGLHLA